MPLLALLALLIAFVTTAPLQASNTESEIQTVLNTQLEAWNRGDIPAMVNTYAPDCIFVGKQVAKAEPNSSPATKRPTRPEKPWAT